MCFYNIFWFWMKNNLLTKSNLMNSPYILFSSKFWNIDIKIFIQSFMYFFVSVKMKQVSKSTNTAFISKIWNIYLIRKKLNFIQNKTVLSEGHYKSWKCRYLAFYSLPDPGVPWRSWFWEYGTVCESLPLSWLEYSLMFTKNRSTG
jgi:hypothetical protein